MTLDQYTSLHKLVADRCKNVNMFDDIVKLAWRIMDMRDEHEAKRADTENTAQDNESLSYARGEFLNEELSFSSEVRELLSNKPEWIVNAVRKLVFRDPDIDSAAFGVTLNAAN